VGGLDRVARRAPVSSGRGRAGDHDEAVLREGIDLVPHPAPLHLGQLGQAEAGRAIRALRPLVPRIDGEADEGGTQLPERPLQNDRQGAAADALRLRATAIRFT
jgi:hypothetical protein